MQSDAHHQRICQEALTLFAQGDLEEFHGLLPECSLGDVAAGLGPTHGLGHGILGQEQADYTVVGAVPNLSERVRVWFRNEHVILVDAIYPQLRIEDLSALGDPDSRLDAEWHQLMLKAGHWV